MKQNQLEGGVELEAELRVEQEEGEGELWQQQQRMRRRKEVEVDHEMLLLPRLVLLLLRSLYPMVNINDFRPIKLWNKVLLKNNKVRLVGKDGTAWKAAQSTDLYLPANKFEPKFLPNTANLIVITDFFNHFICNDIVNIIFLSTNQRIQGKELSAIELRVQIDELSLLLTSFPMV